MKLQLIAPMRGISNYNYPALDAARDLLVAAGHDVWSPADQDRARGWTTELDCPYTVELTADFDYEKAMETCLASLATRDAGVVLGGWEKSEGAQREVEECRRLGIPVVQLRGEQFLFITPEDQALWERLLAPTAVVPEKSKPTKALPERVQPLRTAEALICGDRNNAYGDPLQDFRRTASLWTELLGEKLTGPIQPHEVAMLMAALKLSRLVWSPGNQDSWTNLCGYSALGWECSVAEERERHHPSTLS